jgi:hypothetical protein
VQEPAPSLVEKAEAIAVRIEKGLAEMKATEERLQKFKANEILGGKTDAGQTTIPQITPEQKEKNDRVKALGEATGADWAKKMQ